MNGQDNEIRRDCRECRHVFIGHDNGKPYPHGCLLARKECRLGVAIVENWKTRHGCDAFDKKGAE